MVISSFWLLLPWYNILLLYKQEKYEQTPFLDKSQILVVLDQI